MSAPTHLAAIGKTIKQMRQYRGLTQQQLADAATTRQATIADIEAGKTNFEINTLVRIASALNCHLDINLTPAG